MRASSRSAPSRTARVGQHDQGGALHVVHVHPAVLLLDGGKLAMGSAPAGPCAAGAARLRAGGGLPAGAAARARPLRGGELLQVLRQAVFLGHEHGALRSAVQNAGSGRAGQRVDDGVCWPLRVLLASPPKRWHGCANVAGGFASCRASAGANAASSGYACWNGGTEASTTPAASARSNSTRLAQRCQRLVRLRAAMAGHHGFIVGAQAGARPRPAKRWPDLGARPRHRLQQLKVRGQALAAAAAPAGPCQSSAANQLWKVRICTGRPASSSWRYKFCSASRLSSAPGG